VNQEYFRDLFPIVATHIHLAACSQGALAKPVSDAIDRYKNSLLESGTNWGEAIKKVAETREKFAQLIGAEADEVALLCSVSDAISAIATCLPSEKNKNKIVFTDIDFPTVSHIWLRQEVFKNDISVIGSIDGEIPLELYEKAVTHETLLTSVPHVNYYNGFKQDIGAIAEIVHRKGSLLMVDAYQAAGQIPIKVKEMGIDILVAGTRKYLLGIPGVAFLYVKKDLAQKLKPRATGWLGQVSPFEINNPVFHDGTRRFETGTPAFISVYAACEALKMILDVGVGNIEEYLIKLTKLAIEYGQEKGLNLAGPEDVEKRASLISFFSENISKAEELLRSKNIIVSPRKDVIRIAPHYYNTGDEIIKAVDELVIAQKI